MLSKFIYKALMVFALAFVANVGYSQNYVDSNEAQEILKQEIDHLESNTTTTPLVMGTNPNPNSSVVQVSLMKHVVESLAVQNRTVLEVMNSSFERVNNLNDGVKKDEAVNALNVIKELLS